MANKRIDKIRVLTIDDDPGFGAVMREHLEQIKSHRFECVQAQCGDDGLTLLEDQEIDLVLLDYRLGGEDDGLSVLRKIRETGDFRPIIIMTGHGDEYVAVKMVQSGADAYLVKNDASSDRLEQTITKALQTSGQTREQREQRREIACRISTLTPREREVLDLIISGMTNKEIAAHLYRSEKTIKIHRGNVMAKMEASTPAELTRLVLTVEPAPGRTPHASAEAEVVN